MIEEKDALAIQGRWCGIARVGTFDLRGGWDEYELCFVRSSCRFPKPVFRQQRSARDLLPEDGRERYKLN